MRAQPEGAWAFEPYRINPSICQVSKPFKHCDSVHVKDVLGAPNPFYVDGKVQFPVEIGKIDGCYRSVFGPSWYHSGVINEKCDANLTDGLTRLTGIRTPGHYRFDGQDHHYYLCANQRRFASNTFIIKLLDEMSVEVVKYFHNWLDDPETRIEEAALNPQHDKVKLRVPAWMEDIQGAAKYNHKTWILRNQNKVVIKGKGREFAKPGKFLRITYDLGTPASLAVGDFVERIKTVIAGMGVVQGTQFVKSPDLEALTQVFVNLIENQDFYFPYFSDDSCVSIKCVDGTFLANVDISSCDASHTEVIFNALRNMCKGDRRLLIAINRAIAQCQTDLILRSVCNPKHKVEFSVSTPKLFTGSVLTTLINNIANCFIAASIRYSLSGVDRATLKKSECEGLVMRAAERSGYIVTCAVCETMQQLQFLKHSPCWSDSGRLVPVLNLGVIGRTIGSCWGDLPVFEKVSADINSRIEEYNRRQTSCYKRGARHSILNALVTRYSPCELIGESSVNDIAGDQSNEFVSDEQLALRYGRPASEFAELAELYSLGNFTIKTPASMAVMKLDYGL